ncbi:MAG: glycosyltransferase [Lentisphaerae bacterium]|nr:glycosyltransferase [Lentisphaerota bacterium]
MRQKSVHQLLAGYSSHDAISNESVYFRSVLRINGYRSDIYSEPARVLPDLRKDCFDVHNLAENVKPDDIVLLHLSIGSIVNDVFAELPCKKVLLYHNITPSYFFRGINETTAHNLAWGEEQLRGLATLNCKALADSRFNADEMEVNGWSDVDVLPLLIDLEKSQQKPDKSVLSQYNDGKTTIMFVGRIAPNKKTDHLIKAFHCYQKAVDPHSRMIVVGSWAGTERYHAYLVAMSKELGIKNLVFTGSLTEPQLNAIFKISSLFLCMSEHEGFCAPLLESMVQQVPVMAYAAAAIPETMQSAGVLFNSKNMPMIAEMMDVLIKNNELRTAVIKGQNERIVRYKNIDIERLLLEAIEKV